MTYKYENGEVVEQPTMEKPDINLFQSSLYALNVQGYNDHIKNLRRYPVPLEYRHVWKEGQPLEEGKDFKVNSKSIFGDTGYSKHTTQVAIPIKPKLSQEDEMIQAIRKTTEEACKSPEAARKFLVDAGIIELKQEQLTEPLQPFQYGTQGAHAMHEHEQENYMEKSKEEKKYSYYPFSGIYKIVFKEPGEEEVYIASTYDAEKAHFLATAANAYKEPLADFEKADEENTKGDVWDAAINAFKEAYTFTGNLGFPTNELLKILKKKYLLVELPEPVLQDFKQMDLLNKAADLFKNMIDDGIAESDIQNMESWLNEYENGKAAPFKDALTCLNEVADSRYCIPMPFNYDMLIEAMEAYRNQYDGLQQAVQPNQ